MSSRAVAGWVLYDLANTIFSFNIVSLYFSLWVVNVMGGSDSAYGFTNSLSMAVIFLVSPFLGALTDQAPRRLPFLIVSTFACVGFTLFLGHGGLVRSLTLFALANIAYQAGLQFYDALFPAVSTAENRGRIGGLGIAAGYLGSVIGILTGRGLLGEIEAVPRPDQTARYVVLFRTTALLFLFFSLPCFFLVRERARAGRRFTRGSIAAAARQVRATLRASRRTPGLVRFLAGRALYTDAVNTVIAFMGIYVTNEVGFSSGEASLVLLAAVLFAVAGGLAWGRVVDRIGPKRALARVLGLWVVVFVWAAVVGFLRLPPVTFWPVPCLAGIALGGTWTADRPYMLRLTPPERVGESYGLYGMVGRFAAITGPLLWALVADVLGLGRPAAVLTLLGGVIASILVLRGVSDAPRAWEGEQDLAVMARSPAD